MTNTTTFQVARVSGAQFDEDEFCTDGGTRGEVLFTVDAAYPGAIDRKAVAARLASLGVRLDGFSSIDGAVMSWNVVGGGWVAVFPPAIA